MSDELDVVRRFIEAIDSLTPAQRKDMLRELRQRARDEVMPPLEPEPRWVVDRGWIKPSGPGPINEAEVEQAAADLNALDRDGIVVRPRPWEEAPDDSTVVWGWSGSAWSNYSGQFTRDHKLPWVPKPAGPVSDGADGSRR